MLFCNLLFKFQGISEASSSIERIVFLAKNVQFVQPLTSCVSGVSVTILLLMRVIKASRFGQTRRWVQLFPEVILVVIAAVCLTAQFHWEDNGLDILGDTKAAGIPIPSIPKFPDTKHLKDMVLTAAMIAIIGFVESVAIAKTFSNKHNYSVSPNRELVALGVANIASGLFQGIPAFGSVSSIERIVCTSLLNLLSALSCFIMQISRSKINDRGGARTQMAGLLAGVIVLLAILFLLPYFYYLPKAVLSSIIFVAVLSLLSELPEDLHFIFKIGAWRDLALILITFTATMAVSLEFGTLIAVMLSLLMTIRESSYPRISIIVSEYTHVHPTNKKGGLSRTCL